ncbi:MAG: DUF6152 family protein [Halioglobus sp.]|nr:DUF6152 family protein [Halioglobus sp.]MDE0929213.1 DUF6152 family protein [Halioglobus sp.]
MLKHFLLLLLLLPLATIQAHHSRTAYDLDTEISVKGTVKAMRWRNPHVRYVLEVINEQGVNEIWAFDGSAIVDLVKNGWMEDTVKIGDEVTFKVFPNRKNAQRPPGKKSGLYNRIILSNGTSLPPVGGEETPAPVVAAESDATSKEKTNVFGEYGVTTSKDFSGTWEYYLTLDEILVLGMGLTHPWPLSQKGQENYAAYDSKDDPAFTCQEYGAPQIIFDVYARNWTRHGDRIVVQTEGKETERRVIWLDGRKKPADYKSNPVGFSSGRFDEFGSLIVETTGFPATRWGIDYGLDSSTQKRLTERYTLTNGRKLGGTRMFVEALVEDPVYLERPFSIHGVYNLTDKREFPAANCDPETASAHLEYE